jgi:transcriptional activator SPT7
LEDEGLFADEDEEETGALAMYVSSLYTHPGPLFILIPPPSSGDFADMLGEDYLGLRELGIAQEFNMSSLSIPKKLLKSKKHQSKNLTNGSGEAKSNEPPPPYPPPPKFMKLKSDKVDDQIGLLRGYYLGRFQVLADTAMAKPAVPTTMVGGPMGMGGVPPLAGPVLGGPMQTLPGPTLTMPTLSRPTLSQPQLPPPLPGPTLGPTPTPAPAPTTASGLPSTNKIVVPGVTATTNPTPSQPIDLASLPVVFELPDDQPTAVQMKMGPLGQIVKPGTGGGGGKKKAKGATGTSGAGPSGTGSTAAGGAGAGSRSGSVIHANSVTGSVGSGGGGPDGNGSPKKKKNGVANSGVGSGNGRKKKPPPDAPGGGGPPPGGAPRVTCISACGCCERVGLLIRRVVVLLLRVTGKLQDVIM